MNALIITLIVLTVWFLISIPAYFIAILGALGGRDASKILLLFAAPVLAFVYGREYIKDFFNRKK